MTNREGRFNCNADRFRMPIVLMAVMSAILLCACAQAPARDVPILDVPLTVREAEGVRRAGNPINSGVPLPQGVVHQTDELRVLDGRGNVVLASIEPRARWIGDESLKWVTVHFVAPDLDADGEQHYRLVKSTADLPASPLRAEYGADGRTVVVETGPARFVIPADRLGPFEQVYVRADAARGFEDDDAMLTEPATVELVARNGQSRIVPREGGGPNRAEVARVDDEPFTQQATLESAEIEESGPGRAVVALKGTFSTDENKSLDVTARLYFYAGSSTAQMTFSVRNRQMDGFEHFVGIERLAVNTPLRTDGAVKARFSTDGEAAERDGLPARLAQTGWNSFTLTAEGAEPLEGEQSNGWVELASPAGRLVAGSRWFWQNYPTGLSVEPGGTVAVEVKGAAGDRVDLYTGGAKTHFLFFHFDRGETAEPEGIAAGTTHPLFAACEPAWYCQETKVFGNLVSADPELYQPEHRDLVRRVQEHIDAWIGQIVEQRPRTNWGVNEYGWLNFGSGLSSRSRVFETAEESWWDSNYYDFPHAALVNFLRTGDLINLTTAEEAGLHLADIDICHSFPGRPAWTGAPRSGPVIGHFRNYGRGQVFMGHASFTFYKNESLYELYYLTGERWYRDIGLMSSDFAMRRWGQGALRNLAHGIWGVLSAYHHTHDEKYLDRARFFVDEWGKPWQDRGDGSFQDQMWMYGLALEAYDKYFRITGDKDTARYLVKAVDVLLEEGGGGMINLVGFGLAYEYTGDEKYLERGLNQATRFAAGEPGRRSRTKDFAQHFRASPYFFTYLTRGYEPDPVLPAEEE